MEASHPILGGMVDPPADSSDPRVRRLRRRLDAEFDVLRRAGGQIEVSAPDAEAAAIVGLNLMDPSGVEDAAAAGRAQGKKEAERIRRLWAEGGPDLTVL